MLFINNKSITLIRFGDRVITSVKKGSQLVWQAIRSCFGTGIWRGDKPWVGDDAWKG